MSFLELTFWSSAALVVYTYLVYPIALGMLAKWRERPVRRGPVVDGSVTIILAVHNEERLIDLRLRELTGHLMRSGLPGEIIVVSNGSTDGTAALARAHTKGPVRVLEITDSVGKAAALTAASA